MRETPRAPSAARAAVTGSVTCTPGSASRTRAAILSSPMTRAPEVQAKPTTSKVTCGSRPTVAGTSSYILASFRSEEHTSELQSLMRISYAVFCLTKKKEHTHIDTDNE